METDTDSTSRKRRRRHESAINGRLRVTPRRCLTTDVTLSSVVAFLLQPILHFLLLSTLLLLSFATADQPFGDESRQYQLPDHIKRSENYEIVIPQRVDENGIAFPKHRHYLRRRTRSTVSDGQSGNPEGAASDSSIVYRLNAFGKDIDLRLTPDEVILPDGLRVQHMADNKTWLGADLSEESRHCFHSGSVDQDPLSVAILSTCDSLFGMIHSFNERYFIEPIGNLSDNTDSSSSTDGVPHVIYKLTEESGSCDIKRQEEEELELRHQGLANNDVYRPGSTSPPRRRKRRYLSQQRFVEVMVVADAEMKRFHGDDLEHYLLTLMAIVAHIYRDRSIGNPIKVVVVKVVVLESELAGKMISKNAATTLRGFCDWQKQVNVPNDDDPRHHDTAVLLTKHDICRSNQKCDTLGLAELGTMCDSHRSCSIVKDSGLSAAFTIAHELGHVFSLRHDDECYQFKNRSDLYHIMAPTLDHETKYWSWSECSRNKMTEFLGAGYADCLNDKPPASVKPFPVLNHDPEGILMLPGNAYTVDKQCAHIFEPNSVRCPYLPVCVRLWCTNPDAERVGCSTKHMPWADGTPCSNSGANESMWCIRGQCVLKKILQPVDGQWGPWSPYGPCTRSCGGGIQQSNRQCNNPEPDNGGKYCTGRRIKYKSCNHKDCAEGSVDFREVQCSSFNGKHFNINGLSPDVKWVAKYSGIEAKDRCKLFCRVSTNAAYYQLADRVIDGTKCGLDTTDICVMGQCRQAGCDNRLGSSTARDKCGICGGDNSNCQQIKEEFPDNVKIAYGYNHVTRIPKGATNIDIRQYSPFNTKDDDIYLALKNSTGNYLLNGDFIVSAFHKELQVHGSILEYTGSGSAVERINGTGALLDDIEVYVLTVGELLHKPHVECQYTVRINASKLYIWSKTTMDWAKCSRLCQGKKVKKVVCLSTKTGAIVSDEHCLKFGKKPPDAVKPCHNMCKLSWKVVGESECLAKCNEKGFIHRDIRCQKEPLDSTKVDLNVTMTFVDTEHCRHLRSQPVVDCIGPCLSARWAYTSWSECSRPCGGGEQTRNAFCINELGREVAEEACKVERKVTEQKCNTDTCPHWLPRNWTGCSVSCGSGLQFREVDCVQGKNIITKIGCSPSDEPEHRRECNAGLCPTWDIGKWGQCSTTCGKGIQRREVKCQSPTGATVDDSACDAGSRPRTDATCRITTCTTTIATTLATTEHKLLRAVTPVTLWRTGSWTECSASCGNGSRQRYVSCRDLEGSIASDSFCEHFPKPDYIEPCKIRSCGQWRTGDWTHCSVTCGEGRETRYVACMSLEELEEQMSTQSECDIVIKPPTERMCNRQDCIQDRHLNIIAISSNSAVGTTVWRAGPWGPCSSTCEDGLQRRRVICQDEKGPSDNCDPYIQPVEQRSCNMGSCPYWNYGEWGQCDVTCGGGYQQRIVHCQLPNSDILPDANCLDFAPPRKQSCALISCPPARPSRTHWQKGRWSSCSISCGKGVKQRPVVCVDEAGYQVTDHLCKVQKPKVTTWCRRGRCPFWWSSPWSQCSATCDAGVRWRTVLCMRSQNRTVDPSRCQHLTEPASVSPCTVRKCRQFYWVTGNWSECTHPCSFGSQSRNASCVEMMSGREAEESFCLEMDKPELQRDCSVVPCSNIWITSDWTRCSVSCGQGLQKRAVSCRAMAREGWLLPGHVGFHACNQAERPSSEQNCSYGSCSSLYHWETTSWSQCSKTCGFGNAYRESYCFNSSGIKRKQNDCDASLRPSITRPCYMGPCYSTSCREVKQYTAWKADGEFNLLVEGKLVPIYCSEMARSHPKEYLTLLADENDNYSEIYDKRLTKPNACPENGTRIHHCQKCFRPNYHTAGLTKFSRVRLNITSLQIIGNDFTFSSTTGKKRIPFATGGDCYSRTGSCPQGKFQVTLTGTRFRVASNSEWRAFGYKTSRQIDISTDRQIVKGRCGGHCGRCSPNDGFLKLELLGLP